MNPTSDQVEKSGSETLAIRALEFLASDEGAMAAFLGACGGTIETVKLRAGDAEFLGFVLDHLLQDDSAVVAFAASEGIAPEEVMRARAALPGGDAPHWT